MFKRRILIIDDNDRYSACLRTELIIEGYDVCNVSHEKETIGYLKQAPYPDLILTSTPLSEDVIYYLSLLQSLSEFTNIIPVIQLYANDTTLGNSDRCDYVIWPKFPAVKLAQTIHEIFTCVTYVNMESSLKIIKRDLCTK